MYAICKNMMHGNRNRKLTSVIHFSKSNFRNAVVSGIVAGMRDAREMYLGDGRKMNHIMAGSLLIQTKTFK